MNTFYNEIDSYACEWLQNLMDYGVIDSGIIERKDIRGIKPNELQGYNKIHFFAGIGGWEYALQLAKWPDTKEISLWTGSCPCQPFSTSGRRKGFSDERHLWPYWFWLIKQQKPDIIFGEQVASKGGIEWFSHVANDLERENYTVGSIILPACSVGAPHRRSRIWFVAHSPSLRCKQQGKRETSTIQRECSERKGKQTNDKQIGKLSGGFERSCPSNKTMWRNLVWLPCEFNTLKPTKPGLFPMVDGIPVNMGRLRSYGNSIVPQLASIFIQTVMELLEIKDSE